MLLASRAGGHSTKWIRENATSRSYDAEKRGCGYNTGSSNFLLLPTGREEGWNKLVQCMHFRCGRSNGDGGGVMFVLWCNSTHDAGRNNQAGGSVDNLH